MSKPAPSPSAKQSTILGVFCLLAELSFVFSCNQFGRNAEMNTNLHTLNGKYYREHRNVKLCRTLYRHRDVDHCIALYRGVALTNVTPVGLTWQENVAFGSIFPSDFPSNTSTRLYPLAWVIPRSVSFTETDAGPPPKPVLRNATATLPTGKRGRVQTCTEPICKTVNNFGCVLFAG